MSTRAAAAAHSRAQSVDVGLRCYELLHNDVEAAHCGIVQRRALLPAAHAVQTSDLTSQSTHSLVPRLVVGPGVQQQPDNSFMSVATCSVERSLLEAADA